MSLIDDVMKAANPVQGVAPTNADAGNLFTITGGLLSGMRRPELPRDRLYPDGTGAGLPVPADRLFPRILKPNWDEIRAKFPTSPASGGAPDPVKNPTSTDPVMQALLQQLEYTKQAPAAGGSSGVNRVQVLPSGGGGGGSPLLIVLGLIAVGAVIWFMVKKGKKKGGVQHVSDD